MHRGLGDGAELSHGYKGSCVSEVHLVSYAGSASTSRAIMYWTFRTATPKSIAFGRSTWRHVWNEGRHALIPLNVGIRTRSRVPAGQCQCRDLADQDTDGDRSICSGQLYRRGSARCVRAAL